MITNVQISQVNLDKIKAIVSITFDDALTVNDIRIIEGPKGKIVEMPRRRPMNDVNKYIAHPLTPQAWQMITDSIMEAYEKSTTEGNQQEG
ncbi:septation protein SpoVG family protein [Heliobacterium chlorum]|uniref:Septation protein SpoVG family protein n=1 Tax=Heliobacterium chlorum TaxID=2698 RepID=A0ABR7T166_HELCL|nr:SpoVG family protein [Heliobacterium chlorum]MBC9783862.1 septation protein SpoVG family protein [Heliobacterium chlorum]